MHIRFIALLALSAPVFAQTTELRGITGAEVLVEDLDAGTVRLGLTPESVRTDVELRLREAGFGVLPAAAPRPHALVDITITSTADGRATMVQLQLGEVVSTLRTPALTTVAITWISSFVMAGPSGHSLRAAVKDHVDGFLNEWLAANPRERPGNAEQHQTPGVSLAIQHE